MQTRPCATGAYAGKPEGAGPWVRNGALALGLPWQPRAGLLLLLALLLLALQLLSLLTLLLLRARIGGLAVPRQAVALVLLAILALLLLLASWLGHRVFLGESTSG
jgi:hypothetical protein